MKTFITTIAFVLVSCLVLAQTTTENYVKSTTYKAETTDGQNYKGTTTSLDNDDKIETITYLDGLGRPKQAIAKQAGGNKQNIVTPMVYDHLGRQLIEYLPTYTELTSNALNFLDNDNLILNIQNHYNQKYEEENWPTLADVNAYSEMRLESSPLNRVLEQGAPGYDWRVDHASDDDHTIKFEYLANNAQEVQHFSVIFPTLDTEEPQLYHNGYYAASELYKTITKDENWQPSQIYLKQHTTEEFKNSMGQVILKRTYNGNDVKHDTYYVYDDFGNLTYVLSPKGSDLIMKTATYSSFTDTDSYTHFVPTDRRGDPIANGNGSFDVIINASAGTITVDLDMSFDKPIELKNGPVFQLSQTIPNMIIGTILGGSYTLSIQDGFLFVAGSGTVSSINQVITVNSPISIISDSYLNQLCYQYHYDKRNRLVEKKIPQKGWEFIVYDRLDRPVLTQDALLRENDDWLFTKYDALDRVVYTGKHHFASSGDENAGRISLQDDLDTTNDLSESIPPNAITINGVSIDYTNKVIPKVNIEVYTINYYDSYNNGDLDTILQNPSLFVLDGDTYHVTTDTQSLPTGSLVRVLDTNDWITTVMYYDDKAQPIYTGTRNDYLDTDDLIKTGLDFVGKAIISQTTHDKGSNATIEVTDRFTYDHADRLLTQKQQITGEDEELIVKNAYDELGQLITKDVGGSEAWSLQSIDYSYNVRGWLKQINEPTVLGNDLFAFKINYNTVELAGNSVSNKLFNGNISETIWQTANDATAMVDYRGYFYEYDALNRINWAKYRRSSAGQNGYFNLKDVQYDKNGNIVSLSRGGLNDNGAFSSNMDNLVYSYVGNQLDDVTESGSNSNGFTDVGGTQVGDYVYDDNGNMIEDKNKDITEILYNHLNLPTQVKFNNLSTKKIDYIYDATGLKMKKVVNDNGNITNTEYAGNYIYENSTLKFFSHPEGYIEPEGSDYNYIYQYKDHLGNIRLSYTDPNNSYQNILDSDLTNSYNGWVHNGNVVSELVNGTLRVDVDLAFEGIKHDLPDLTVSPGDVLDIKLDFDKGTTQSNVRLYFQELDSNGNHLSWNTINGNIQTGSHNYSYTVNAANKLRLRIDKDNTNTSTLTSFYIDHVSVTSGTIEIIEENNYYPFGLKHKGYNNVINGTDHRYGYVGMEENEELGLDWLDFGARNFDPAIGRWMNIDNMAEKYFEFSPYHYAANNPILNYDFNGEDFTIYYIDENKERQSFVFNGRNGADAPDSAYVQSFITAYNYNVENGGGKALQDIAGNSEMNVLVQDVQTEFGKSSYSPVHNVLDWSPTMGIETENGTIMSPATILEHEGDHALSNNTDPDAHDKRRNIFEKDGTSAEERRVIDGNEQCTAACNNEISPGSVTRTSHTDGDVVITNGPTSNTVNRKKTFNRYKKLPYRNEKMLKKYYPKAKKKS